MKIVARSCCWLALLLFAAGTPFLPALADPPGTGLGLPAGRIDGPGLFGGAAISSPSNRPGLLAPGNAGGSTPGAFNGAAGPGLAAGSSFAANPTAITPVDTIGIHITPASPARTLQSPGAQRADHQNFHVTKLAPANQRCDHQDFHVIRLSAPSPERTDHQDFHVTRSAQPNERCDHQDFHVTRLAAPSPERTDHQDFHVTRIAPNGAENRDKHHAGSQVRSTSGISIDDLLNEQQ